METKEKIIALLRKVERPGIEELIQYLCLSDFFEAPASTKFHGCYAGGLADHSYSVYKLLSANCVLLNLGTAVDSGQKPLAITPDAYIIPPLLHDVCKIGTYLPIKEGSKFLYYWNKAQPKGHATLSISRIAKYIALTEIETLMIKFHMGVYGLNEFYEEGGWQTGEYPIRGDYSKDEGMTKEESQKARYGMSLANAWYHNPIVKLMYFCDELSTMESKYAN